MIPHRIHPHGRRFVLPQLIWIMALGAGLVLACSSDGPDETDGDTGSAASGGRMFGSGGSQGQTLDRDALAENCADMAVSADAACSQAELVCPTASGTLCICGGVPPETGQDPPSDNDDGGGRPRPWDDDDDPGEEMGIGGNAASGDRVWVCFSIGLPPGTDDGEGGTLNQGGQGGAF